MHWKVGGGVNTVETLKFETRRGVQEKPAPMVVPPLGRMEAAIIQHMV